MLSHKLSLFGLLLIALITSVVSVHVTYFGNYEEGRKCGTNLAGNGYFGKCMKIKNCLSAFNEYVNNQRVLQVCGYSANKNPKEDLICCSMDDLDKSQPDKPRLEIKRSLEYNECVTRYLKFRRFRAKETYFVLGGRSANKEDFPNMVAVGWTQEDNSVEYNCGGSIITEFFIVTAGHCTSLFGSKPDVVRIGDLDLISDFDDEHLQQLQVARIIRHPDYSFRSTYNDIALIKVDREIKMNRFVAPACILHDPVIQYYEAAGFGQTGYHANKANKLLKVSLERWGQNECINYYNDFDNQKLSRGIIEEQICAKGIVVNGTEMDTCLGDSGGGIQYDNQITIGDNIYYIPTLVGIISFGHGAPSVYTNVTSYVDWMESVVFAE